MRRISQQVSLGKVFCEASMFETVLLELALVEYAPATSISVPCDCDQVGALNNKRASIAQGLKFHAASATRISPGSLCGSSLALPFAYRVTMLPVDGFNRTSWQCGFASGEYAMNFTSHPERNLSGFPVMADRRSKPGFSSVEITS
ncbi:hypothetical protein WK15_23155 [Burkholderia ubonensis]|nr:hypothetical protein WK15_22560 [Burkholderia ubonensis]KVR23073.1 hypothetical protein WK15_23155 [Burkholderia ubonensis]